MSIDLEDVKDMVRWARSRIDHCRTVERKHETNLAPNWIPTLIEARVERRALKAVLEQLGVSEVPGEKVVKKDEGATGGSR